MATGKDGNQSQPLVAAGILQGVGLAGFFDGILFHQLLQWHYVRAHLHRHLVFVAFRLAHRSAASVKSLRWGFAPGCRAVQPD